MKCAEAVVKILEREGIQDAFGIPGASINPVYQYLAKSNITHHLMRHEEAAVHAADGYFRASGKLALSICTSGPGATNFVTGLYTAWVDSIPLIAITGQNLRSLMGKMAFQCVDMAEITKTLCKKTYCVMNPEDLPSIFNDAFRTAREGRQGPVLIDLPLDIQIADIDFSSDSYEPAKIVKLSPEEKFFPEVINMLDSAVNPLIIMGGGVVAAHAEEKLIGFAEYMNIPVITTYMAKGAIPEDHYLNAGLVGTQVGASSIGNRIFLDSDVVIGIGCRFTDRHTGNLAVYKGNRKFIHIDIDPNEIGKIITPEIGIVGDADLALSLLMENAAKSGGRRTGSDRVNTIKTLKDQQAKAISTQWRSWYAWI
jgi:tartronate-semialdehyde synthase